MLVPASTPLSKILLSTSFLIVLFYGLPISAENDITNIGAIINVNSRIGKEEKISMEIAVQAFNNASSNKHKLVLHVSDSGGDPLQASTAADDLIKDKHVQAIMGMEKWKEATLVTEISNRAQVPVIAFSAPWIIPPLISVRWPFLVRMANNDSVQIQCVTSIVSSYGWRRVIAIYQDDGYNTDLGILTVLSDALRAVGTDIEHWLAFPPLSRMSNPKAFIQEELKKVNNIKSRVFIIIRSSIELATNIVSEAKHIGLMGKDSVWIATDSVANLVDTIDSTVMSSMEGIIGIKTHFSKTSPSFISFSHKFRSHFRSIYPEEDKSEPGLHALHAYDTISTIALALEKSANKGSTTTSRTLLGNILSSNFTGLSGPIQFEKEELCGSVTYEIVNFVGTGYTRLKFWSPAYGFSDNVIDEKSKQSGGAENGWILQVLGYPIHWPGKLDRAPLGWAMPSDAKPMVIGVPLDATFARGFVNITDRENPTGISIDVFNKAVELLNYDLPHVFVPFPGLYDALVDQVYWKKFDAAVGDFTISSNRSNYVDFTQPYAGSESRMVVPVELDRFWLFLKPFSTAMWVVLGIVFLYTMLAIWFLEHESNPEFNGPWKDQLSTIMFFSFSTLFFAHRENTNSNFTRVAMVVWLFVVFLVVKNYEASLTSMLTVERLEPTVSDIETLRRSNSSVGCYGTSSMRKYLEKVLQFDPKNIVKLNSDEDIQRHFRDGSIKAVFLEYPYQRLFLSKYCKQYKVVGPKYRYGGLGFVFPKGSPIATDFSKAFLQLAEDRTLDNLETFWFKTSPKCSTPDSEDKKVTLSSFWTIFLVTVLASTFMLILDIIHLRVKHRHSLSPPTGITPRGQLHRSHKQLQH